MSSDNDWDKSVYTQDYVVVIVGYLALPCMVFLTVMFLKRYNTHKKTSSAEPQSNASVEQNTIRMITRVSIIAIFLYLATAILMTIVLTKWIFIDQEHGMYINDILANLAVLPYQINLLASLFFIVAQRLNLLLKNRCIHVASYVLPAVACFICIVLRNITRYAVREYNIILTKLNSYIDVIVLIFLLIYLALGIVYVHQISKMMKIRIDVNMEIRSTEMDENKTLKTTSENANEPNEVLVTFKTVEDTVRCALLVMICAVSCFAVPICLAISEYKHPDHINTLVFLGGLIDTVINTICIFLLFGFAESDYLKVCGVCHRCVLKACVNREVRRFRKRNVDLKGLETHEQYVSLIVDDFAVQKPYA
eukprot:42873_1